MAAASPIASPLEIRAWRRSAQRSIRLAVNDFNAARDIWQEAAITGRIAAAESTNAHLQQLYLPNQTYGALSNYRAELLAASTTKLEHRKNAAMQRLKLACQSLSTAEGCMRMAIYTADLDDCMANALLNVQPVFASLPLYKLVEELRGAARMYETELRTKYAVAQGLRSILDRRKESNVSDINNSDSVRGEMQVLLAAWMLQPDIEDDGIDAMLALVSDEMKGF